MENEGEGAMVGDRVMSPQRFCYEDSARKNQQTPVNGLARGGGNVEKEMR